MNVLNASDEQTFVHAKRAELLGQGQERLAAFAKSRAELRGALRELTELGDENVRRRCDRMIRQLEALEPSVTLIGQIKSGKTSLVNALIGSPGLLPADVNPWTSVVTSLHLHPEKDGFQDAASFSFFDAEEWDRLVSGGGRIGELASRAGADDELEKIKNQVAEMREKSRQRLGRKFEVMLGQKRDYGYYDKDLIERYVCLGEEPDGDEEDVNEAQGRFADITKSADIFMQRAALPQRLCLRDTPGVNDTFMMREQITIRAIRDSRICVVVLSAHQALSSTDMALIRLITHVKSRDVIIFVNRIDELSDPATQVDQIRLSISETLKKHKGPEDAKVLFGSALWAQYALCSNVEELPSSSFAALNNWLSHKMAQPDTDMGVQPDAETRAWHMSGLPALQDAIATRIIEGIGATTLQRIATSAKNLATGLTAAERIVQASVPAREFAAIDGDTARNLLDEVCARHKNAMQAEFERIQSDFADRMTRVQQSFLERATASLVAHLEQYGELSPWKYDPAGLRVLLNSSHKVLARKSQSAFQNAAGAAAAEISEVYARAFSIGTPIEIATPRPPRVPPPVTLGRTIALDLSGGWWKRWWIQRRGYQAYAASFHDLIKSETDSVISELRDDLAQAVRKEARESFDAFLNEQVSVFQSLDSLQKGNSETFAKTLDGLGVGDRQARIQTTLKTLEGYIAS
ncbi:MAG: dynamin family protein [Pseudomonadota bacterium]